LTLRHAFYPTLFVTFVPFEYPRLRLLYYVTDSSPAGRGLVAAFLGLSSIHFWVSLCTQRPRSHSFKCFRPSSWTVDVSCQVRTTICATDDSMEWNISRLIAAFGGNPLSSSTSIELSSISFYDQSQIPSSENSLLNEHECLRTKKENVHQDRERRIRRPHPDLKTTDPRLFRIAGG
jgi:hypothetical protein